jgi:hypothetical protein
VLISCRKEIKSEKGGIDIISNVYFDASKGLSKMQSFHLSRMNYSGELMIELVPDLEFPEMTTASYFIKDSVFYDLNNNTSSVLSELQKKKTNFGVCQNYWCCLYKRPTSQLQKPQEIK